MTEYNDVVLMATHLSSGTLDQSKVVTDLILRSDSEELVNILEVSREVAFDNTGDDELYLAVNNLINFIQMHIATRVFKN